MRSLKSYSPQWRELIERAEIAGEYLIPVNEGTEIEKRNRKIGLRAGIYSFLAAIRQEAKPGTWAERYKAYAEETAIKIVDEGVLIYPKKSGTLSKIIEASFDSDQGPKASDKDISEEAAAAMQRILARQESQKRKTEEETAEELKGPLYRAHRMIDENGNPTKPKEQE